MNVKMISKLSLLLVVFLFTNSLAFALDLSGRITNASTGLGQPGLKVEVSEYLTNKKIQTKTDEDGFYKVTGLSNNNRYYLKLSGDENGLIIPKMIFVETSKSDLGNYNYTYFPKFSVSGKVSSDFSKNLAGMNVIFKSSEPVEDYNSAVINEKNMYDLKLIYNVSYEVFASSNNQIYGVLNNEQIKVDSDNYVKDIKIAPVFYAVGKVFDKDTNQGFANVAVEAVDTESNSRITGFTSSDGYYSLFGLFYGRRYRIYIHPPAGYSQPRQITTNIIKTTITDINFPLQK